MMAVWTTLEVSGEVMGTHLKVKLMGFADQLNVSIKRKRTTSKLASVWS